MFHDSTAIAGQGLVTVEDSRSHLTQTLHTPYEDLWTKDRLVAETNTYTACNKYKRRTFMLSVKFEPVIIHEIGWACGTYG